MSGVYQTIPTNLAHTTGNESIAGIKTFIDPTAATSSSSAGVIFTGGIGVAKNSFFAGTVKIVSPGVQLLTIQSTDSNNSGILLQGTDRSVFINCDYPNALSMPNCFIRGDGSNPSNHNLKISSANSSIFYGSLGTNLNGDIVLFQNVTGKNLLLSGGKVIASDPITAPQYKLSALNTAPLSATDAGTLGELKYDGNYMYLCTGSGSAGSGTWKRCGLTTW